MHAEREDWVGSAILGRGGATLSERCFRRGDRLADITALLRRRKNLVDRIR